MFRQKTAKDWQRILDQANVPAAPIFSIQDVIRDPQVHNRRMIIRARGDVPHLGSPMGFSRTKPEKTTPSPLLGQHTKKILAELGYSIEEIQKLKANRVLA